jgi:hypothetical protein
MTRTFSRADWDAAQAQWRAGDFSPEWRDFRHQAAMRGMIYPPEGTKFDGWDEEEPSQRAILIRAIRETPTLLRESIGSSKSWGEVVGKILARVNGQRADAIDVEGYERRRRAAKDPSHRQALHSLADILDAIADSR